MAILGTVIKQGLSIKKRVDKVTKRANANSLQRKTLLKLLTKAKDTEFGETNEFEAILNAKNPAKLFQKVVPIYDYDKIFEEWWHRTLEGERDICWPGKIRYFALSSGTSGSASKYIPVTTSIIKSMRKAGVRQILSLTNYDLSEDIYTKGVLVVGGSSDLVKKGNYFQGDLSGINQAKMPFYTRPFYKPGKKIARERDWNIKIEEIVKNAPNWDIVMITGVPAWNQIILEKVIAHYKLNHIHEIWPNFKIFVYGGVAIEPYKKSFEKLLGKPIHYLETYLASEGFIAYQSRKDIKGMELILDNGIFVEFVPFNEKNFSPEGKISPHAQALLIDEVEENVDYALLISTNAGAWRYLIGDTVRFTSKKHNEIVITGRTKHFLSLCGEHLSTDNMNKAVELLGEHFNFAVKEYTVSGISSGTLFGHKWYLGAEAETTIHNEQVTQKLDELLCQLNDDYAVERNHALKEIKVEIIPARIFYQWMEMKGKMGAQNKFPRVLQKAQFSEWEEFVKENLK